MRTLRRYNLARPVGRLTGWTAALKYFPPCCWPCRMLTLRMQPPRAGAPAQSLAFMNDRKKQGRVKNDRTQTAEAYQLAQLENVTFDCARLTYMIGVNAVGKTTILDAIRYCLTTNRNFNALGNKKSGRTLQVRCTQSSAARTPTAARAILWLHRGRVLGQRQAHPLRHRGAGGVRRPHAGAAPRRSDMVSFGGRCTLEQLPFIDPRPVHPAQRRTSSPQRAVSPTPAAPAKRGTASAVRWASGAPPAPWAKSSTRCSRWAPAWTRSPTSGSFVPVHPAPAGAGSGRFAGRPAGAGKSARRAGRSTDPRNALEEIVDFGREAAESRPRPL